MFAKTIISRFAAEHHEQNIRPESALITCLIYRKPFNWSWKVKALSRYFFDAILSICQKQVLYFQTKRLASRYSQEAVDCLKGMRDGEARWQNHHYVFFSQNNKNINTSINTNTHYDATGNTKTNVLELFQIWFVGTCRPAWTTVSLDKT